MKVILPPKEYVFFYTYHTKDQFTYPLWYAGFGSPWRLSENMQDAITMASGDINEVITLKALERHTKTQWFTIPVKETYIPNDTTCKSCGYVWSDAEANYVLLNSPFGQIETDEGRSERNAERFGELKLGSIFKNPFNGFTDYQASADRILKANYCKKCGKVCGNCRAKSRGPTAGKCVSCLKPRDRRFD